MELLTPEELEDARETLAELQRLEDELHSLMNESNPDTLRSRLAVPALQARLANIKAEIKEAAKQADNSRPKEISTEIKRCFYDAAVQRASANFRMPVNADPFTRSWVSGLYDSCDDISYYRIGLEKYIKERC
jgi:hypothetical protein